MGSRGRSSSAELAVISGGRVQSMARPEPPDDLTGEQADEWRAVVSRLPAEWFQRETHAMLGQYCRHVVAARRVAQMIESLEAQIKADSDEPDADRLAIVLSAAKTLDRLLKMQEREGRALSSLATRMRISQQATYDKQKKKPIEGKKPWD